MSSNNGARRKTPANRKLNNLLAGSVGFFFGQAASYYNPIMPSGQLSDVLLYGDETLWFPDKSYV